MDYQPVDESSNVEYICERETAPCTPPRHSSAIHARSAGLQRGRRAPCIVSCVAVVAAEGERSAARMDDDDVATLAVIAEMDLDDARDVCTDEGVPFQESEPLHALQEKLRLHMCPQAATATALEPEPEPEPKVTRPQPPPRPVPHEEPYAQANASGWLKKENHHLIEENKRLQRDLGILTKAAGGERDIDRLRKKLAAANAVVAQRDALRERVSDLERQLEEARQAESDEDEEFLTLIESQEKLRQACQKQLDEARGISSGWQERYERLQLDHRHALEAARNATGAQQQHHMLLQRQLEEQRQTEEASRAAGALQTQQRIADAERAATQWQRQFAEMQAKEATLMIEHQREVAALQAQLQEQEAKVRNAQCRSCKRLLDELDDDTAAAGEVQRMLQRADQEHHDAQRSLLQHVAELDAKVLTLEKEARDSEQHVRDAARRLHMTAPHPPVRGVVIDPGTGGLADASLRIKLDEKKATLQQLETMGLPPSELQLLQAEIASMEAQTRHTVPKNEQMRQAEGQQQAAKQVAGGSNGLGLPPPPYAGHLPQHGNGEATVVVATVPVAQPVSEVPVSQAPDHTVVSELMMFGFPEHVVRDALQATGGDKQAAANRLFG
jgi:hypothetical protein